MARILMLSSLWPPQVLGGAEAYAAALAERLRARGHEVMAVTRGVGAADVAGSVPPWPYRLEAWAGQPRWRRLAFHALDQWEPRTRPVLERAVRAFRPTVVHSHAVTGMSVTALTTPSRLGVPHVHTLHDYWLLCQRTSLVRADGQACESRCRGCAVVSAGRVRALRGHGPDVVIAPSGSVAREHADVPGIGDRVRVVHHPVERVVRRDRRGDRPTFGFIGQLTPVKGLTTLLAAFATLPAGSARLVIAGRGPLEPAPGAPVPAGVEYRGWVGGEAKEAFFDSLDCLVVPSQWKEPSGLVINEARGRGIPVIASRAGGIPEVVPASCRPLLFDPGDAAGLGGSMQRFLAAPGDFQVPPHDLGPTWDEHLDAVVRAYDDAARARAGGGAGLAS